MSWTDFMTSEEFQSVYTESLYDCVRQCHGCGTSVHVGQFMAEHDGVCPKCNTEHEAPLPLFLFATGGKCLFLRKQSINQSKTK